MKKQPNSQYSSTKSYFVAGILIWLCITTIVGIMYKPVLQFGWSGRDDPYYLNDTMVTQPLTFEKILRLYNPFDPASKHQLSPYSPTLRIAFRYDYARSEFLPDGSISAEKFHGSNRSLHLMNTLLVYLLSIILLWQLQKRGFSLGNMGILITSGLVALWFGISPVQVEAVAWIGGKKDVLGTCLILISFLWYLAYLHHKKNNALSFAFWFLSFIFFTLSMTTKITFVLFSVFLFFVEIFLYDRLKFIKGVTLVSILKKSGKIVLDKIPLIAISVPIVIAATEPFQGVESAINNLDVGPYSWGEKCMFVMYAINHYFASITGHIQFSAQYLYPVKEFGNYPNYITWGIPFLVLVSTAGVVFVLVKITRNNTVLGFFLTGMLSSFLVIISPILPLNSIGVTITADRYMYFAIILLLLPLAVLVIYGFIHTSSLRNKFLITGSVLVWTISLGAKTNHRIPIWKSEPDLWESVVTSDPTNSLAMLNLAGNLLMRSEGMYPIITKSRDTLEARSWFFKSLEQPIHGRYEYYLRSGMAYSLGELSLAKQISDSGLVHYPEYAPLYLIRGKTSMQLGNQISAKNDFLKGLSLDTTQVPLYENLANYYFAGKDFKKAFYYVNKTIEKSYLRKQKSEAYFKRSLLHLMEKQYSLAKKDAEAAQLLGKKIPSDYWNAVLQEK